MNEVDLAWAAGFFDGEGCVQIRKCWLRSGRENYQLLISIDQLAIEPLADFRRIVAERGCLRPSSNGTASSLRYVSAEAARVLVWIVPHLRLKRREALLGLAFQRRMDPKNRRPILDSEARRRERFYRAVRACKRRAA